MLKFLTLSIFIYIYQKVADYSIFGTQFELFPRNRHARRRSVKNFWKGAGHENGHGDH